MVKKKEGEEVHIKVNRNYFKNLLCPVYCPNFKVTYLSKKISFQNKSCLFPNKCIHLLSPLNMVSRDATGFVSHCMSKAQRLPSIKELIQLVSSQYVV